MMLKISLVFKKVCENIISCYRIMEILSIISFKKNQVSIFIPLHRSMNQNTKRLGKEVNIYNPKCTVYYIIFYNIM